MAQAAALCCGGHESTSSSTGECGIEKTVETVLAPNQKGKGKERETRPSCCQPSRPSSPPAKRRRRRSRSKSPTTDMAGQKGPSLPPILCIPPTSALAPVLPPPEFPAIPPLNAIASLAGFSEAQRLHLCQASPVGWADSMNSVGGPFLIACRHSTSRFPRLHALTKAARA